MGTRVLVACFGNVLRGDDGFGNVVAERLLAAAVPAGVVVLEVGIGGIHLVHELLSGVQTLIVVDAVDLARTPGTVVVQRPDVLDVSTLTPMQRRDQLADMHYATPERALMLARALEVLPEEVWVVGGQVAEVDGLGQGLSSPLEPAVAVAVAEVKRLVASAGVAWA